MVVVSLGRSLGLVMEFILCPWVETSGSDEVEDGVETSDLLHFTLICNPPEGGLGGSWDF